MAFSSRLLFPHAGSRPPSMSDPIARIAVLFSPGSWGVWELDARNGIRHVASGGNLETDAHAPPSSPRVTDLYWLPLPMPGGNGGVLAAGCEDASLSFIHVEEGPPLVPAAGSVAATTGSGPSTPATLTPATARRATLEGAAFRAALVAEGHAERVSAHDKVGHRLAFVSQP